MTAPHEAIVASECAQVGSQPMAALRTPLGTNLAMSSTYACKEATEKGEKG